MTDFQPGEIVDITIKGARVVGTGEEGHDGDVTPVIQVDLAGPGYFVTLPRDWFGVVDVERVAPPEWPPRPGDVWLEDQPDPTSTVKWFAQRYHADFDIPADYEGCNDEGWRILMVPLNGGAYGESEKRPEQLLGARLRLLHREDPEGDEPR